MPKISWKNLALALASATVALAGVEVALRVAVTPSDVSYGTLFGHELPPVEVIPHARPQAAPDDTPLPPGLVGGATLTHGDVYGLLRGDPVLGYAPRERAVSRHGWWRTNGLGARRREEVSPRVPLGRRRLLVFGDSFAAASRVPQEQAWFSVMERSRPGGEVVSLGVDGYGMAQCFLRFEQVSTQVETDAVALVFVPFADLWRDLNTLRWLGEAWTSFTVMPRYELEGGALRLVPSPWPSAARFYAANPGRMSTRLEKHLRRHDRFYFPWRHDARGLLRSPVLMRLLDAARHARTVDRMRNEALLPGSEAMRVSTRIFEAMRDVTEARGARFLLIVLPSEVDVRLLAEDPGYAARWRAMLASLRARGVPLVDLGANLVRGRAGLDVGCDGTHYGPVANRRIATLIDRALAEHELWPSSESRALHPAPGAPPP